MDPFVLYYGLMILTAVGGVIAYVVSRKQRQRWLADFHEFARQVGGIEHIAPTQGWGPAPTRPKFGVPPLPYEDPNRRSFDYAIEFSRGAFDVVVFKRKKPSNGKTQCFVEVRVPQCPFLFIGPERWANFTLELRAQRIRDLPPAGHRFDVASSDEAFARSVITPEVANWVSTRLGHWFLPITIEDGTVRTDTVFSSPKYFSPKYVLNKADLLIEFIRILPQHTWSYSRASEA